MPLGGAVARLVLLIVSDWVCNVRGFLSLRLENVARWPAVLLLVLRSGRLRLRMLFLALAVVSRDVSLCDSCWVFVVRVFPTS